MQKKIQTLRSECEKLHKSNKVCVFNHHPDVIPFLPLQNVSLYLQHAHILNRENLLLKNNQ